MSSAVGFTPSDDKPKQLDRYVSTVAIAAALIVAFRISKIPEKDLTISKLANVEGSVRLAMTILDEARRLG